eukprot:11079021-Heterocapsa_arctica.AAC.1
MGWSWSLHYCQCVVSRCMNSVLEPGAMIVDKAAGVALASAGTVDGASPAGHAPRDNQFMAAGAVYVDNFAVLSTSQTFADQKILEAKTATVQMGLI